MESNGATNPANPAGPGSHLDPSWPELVEQARIRATRKASKKRSGFRYQHINGSPSVSPEMEEIIKKDYLTGQYNSVQLAEKYGIKRFSALQRIVQKGWRAELKASGVPLPLEPKIDFKKRSKEFWRLVEVDYMMGSTRKEICIRHGIQYYTLVGRIKKFGWDKTKKRLGEAAILKTARAVVSKPEQMERMAEAFIDSALVHFQRLMDELSCAKESGQTMDLERFDKIITTFTALYNTIKKVPGLNAGKITSVPTVENNGNEVKKNGATAAPLAQQKAPTVV